MSCSISLQEILDYAAKIGVQAKLDDVRPAQLEGVLASLDFVEDAKASLLVTAAFAHRQAARLEKGENTARLINEALSDLFGKGCEKREASRLLRLAKWVFECVENVDLPPNLNIKELTFQKLLELLRRSPI